MSDRQIASGRQPTRFFVFMGVSGVGKSTVADNVALALGGYFLEADRFHSEKNVRAMSEGRPLTDEDRWPWLEAVCDAARDCDAGRPVMIACSALTRRYRDFLRDRLDGVVFIHLNGPAYLIRRRMEHRRAHFMPPAMLDSQLAALETTEGEPDCFTIDISEPRDRVVAQAVSLCRQHSSATRQSEEGAGEKPTSSEKA